MNTIKKIICVAIIICLCEGCISSAKTIPSVETSEQVTEEPSMNLEEYEKMKAQQNTVIERPIETIPPYEKDDDMNAPVPQGINANGQTYGPFGIDDNGDPFEWDLMAVYQNGVMGFVLSSELNGDHYVDPDSGRIYLPIYAEDGETLRGYFYFNE